MIIDQIGRGVCRYMESHGGGVFEGGKEMTNENKKIVADYMGWLTHPKEDWYDAPVYFAAGKAGNINFDLNDAGLVVAEMQKRGELYIFLTWIDNNLPYKEWSNFIAWIFNPDNFFSAFVEWRKGK